MTDVDADRVHERPDDAPPKDESPLLALRKSDGSELLTISRDGQASFPEGSSLSDLSREFWSAVAMRRPDGMPKDARVFLCGPIETGFSHQRLIFDMYGADLARAGYQFVNPTRIENFSPENPYELNLRLTLIGLLQCDAVALLPGWQSVDACRREVEIATACGMSVAPVSAFFGK